MFIFFAFSDDEDSVDGTEVSARAAILIQRVVLKFLDQAKY